MIGLRVLLQEMSASAVIGEECSQLNKICNWSCDRTINAVDNFLVCKSQCDRRLIACDKRPRGVGRPLPIVDNGEVGGMPWRPAAKVPTSFVNLEAGHGGDSNFTISEAHLREPSRIRSRELQRAVADLYRWGAICRSGIELFLMKATWKPWFVCGNRTRNSVKRYEQLYRGAENPALLA